jgi:hypothetical protein
MQRLAPAAAQNPRKKKPPEGGANNDTRRGIAHRQCRDTEMPGKQESPCPTANSLGDRAPTLHLKSLIFGAAWAD